MSDRYQTPDEGATDWHVPVNENFSRLETDVEIRDQETARDQYDPVDGAKFLATDTGAVYLGDGSAWQRLGEIVPEQSGTVSGGTAADGAVVAAPDEVQQALDDVSTGDQHGAQARGKVRLLAGQEYDLDSTVTVPPGTVLECNGALLRPTGDFDVLHVERNAAVSEPHISLAGVDWASIAILIGPKDTPKVNAATNPAAVTDAHLFNDDTTGIGLQFRGGDKPCSMIHASANINKFARGLEFYAAGSDTSGRGDWSNGNRFFGTIGKSTIPISMRSEGAAVGGNVVRAQVQPNKRTEWLIKQHDAPEGAKIRGNQYLIYPWDASNVSNAYQRSDDRRAPWWYIGTGQQEYNACWDLSGKYSNEFVVNKSTTGADRNGMFVATGITPARGAVGFDHRNTYRPSGAGYHPES